MPATQKRSAGAAAARIKPAKTRAVKTRAVKAGTLSIRVDDATCRFIDRGAAIAGLSRSEFMIQSARQKAEEMLLNQRLFVLNDEDWKAFNDALDAPPRPNAALKALLSRPAPWQK